MKRERGMGDYLRTTRETALDSLDPSLLAAIRAHVEKYELGDIAASALMCCETTSTKPKRGLFGGKAEIILTGVLLTPQWLIWATAKDDQSPAVLSARLRDIQVQDYEKSGMYKMIQDAGLNISGLRTDAVELGSAFIGLGPEPAAEEFRIMLKEALAKA
jgi:hypothetical protein